MLVIVFNCFEVTSMVKNCTIQDHYDLTSFILLARYRTKAPKGNQNAYCSYARIARLLNCSTERVRKVCMRYFKK